MLQFWLPSFPVYANVSAAPIDDVAAALSEQLTSPVRFADSLAAMAAAGVEAFVHIGPGDVTAAMAKRTVKGTTTLSVSSLEDVAAAAAAVQ